MPDFPLSENKLYYPGLDSLRGIAITLVLLYHYFPFFRIGWIGVDLFFVLSGFLITETLLKMRGTKNYFKNFFLRRAFRIFPLYYLTLATFLIAAPLFFSNKSPASVFSYYTYNQVWFWTFTQNWLIIKKGFPPEPFLVHFWSLAIEEQFYVVWPFLVYFINSAIQMKKIIFFLFLIALSVRLYLWFAASDNHSYYYNTIARFDSLACGAFLAYLMSEQQKIPRYFIISVTLAFILVVTFSALIYKNLNYDSPLLATIGYSISALFFMVLCYISVTKESTFLKNNFLRFLGRISFSIYVFHLPVFLIVSFLLNKGGLFDDSSFIGGIALPFISITITLMISFTSYSIFELPILRLKNKFT